MKKTLIWIAAGALVAYVVFWGGPQLFQEKLDPQSQERLGKIAAELNRSTPVMINSETELTIVEAHHAMLIYKYRLAPYLVSQLNHEKFAADAKQRLAPLACNQAETRDEYLKKGITLRYSYFDKNKEHIATVDVTPADCGF